MNIDVDRAGTEGVDGGRLDSRFLVELSKRGTDEGGVRGFEVPTRQEPPIQTAVVDMQNLVQLVDDDRTGGHMPPKVHAAGDADTKTEKVGKRCERAFLLRMRVEIVGEYLMDFDWADHGSPIG